MRPDPLPLSSQPSEPAPESFLPSGLEEILQRVSDGIVAFDRHWNYTYVNAKAAEMLGRAPEELVGKHVWTLFPEAIGTSVYEAYHRAMTTQAFVSIENYFAPWDRWFENRIYSDETGVTAYFTDITDFKLSQFATQASQKALQESEERRKLAIEGSKDAIWDWDVVKNTVVLSSRWQEMRGGKAEEIRCSPSAWSDGIHPEDFDRVMQAVQAHFHKQTEYFNAEYRIKRVDGSYMWISDRGQAIWNDQGDVIRMAGSETDIGHLKQIETELQTLNWESEQRIQLRTAELQASNQELESFSYSVSHDLRAPLRGIDGFARMLQEDYGSQLPEPAQQYLQVIQDQAKQMGQLIDALLEFSRLGRCELNKQLVLPNDLINQVIQELQSELKGREIEFAIASLPVCQADQILLKQVWMNLLANAIKYTRKKVKATITIDYCIEADQVIYSIQDNGVGFDMRHIEKLFGVFQRLHRASEFEGNGVGLALVQRIVHRHGGRIWAEACLEKGAAFFFTLPQG
jgi:PAS domain S-box-containing protein